MKRYLVHLTQKQIDELGNIKKATGIPKAELIRRAIDKLISEYQEANREQKGE